MKRTIITLALFFSFACLFANAVSEINVISREEGSGTRGAFVELIGVEQKVDGVKKDLTVLSSEIANSTSVVITSVQGNRNAIGYISLGSLSDKVKAVSVDGVIPSTTSVKDGSYPIARPFNIGIPMDCQDRVFERFFRVDKSRSKEKGGSGLGLSVVKNNVQRLDARLTLQSRVGEGTRIDVFFRCM